jgi:phage/plasmid-associated DNA primase
VDEYDGGIARRMICVPYKSTFVDIVEEVDKSKNRYLRDWDIEKKFEDWRYVMMKVLIEYSNKVISIPREVDEHTKKYLDRENIMKRFIEETIERTDDVKDYIKQTELYNSYVAYCKAEGVQTLKKDLVYDDLHNILDEDLFRANSNGMKKVWRCYRLKMDDCEIIEEGN